MNYLIDILNGLTSFTFNDLWLLIGGYLSSVIGYFAEDPFRLIGLVAMPIAFCGARLISRNGNMWHAHLLFVTSNTGLIIVYFHNQQWELIFGQTAFLWTSIEGSFTWKPKAGEVNNGSTSPIGETI
jgi:hypothetical protein